MKCPKCQNEMVKLHFDFTTEGYDLDKVISVKYVCSNCFHSFWKRSQYQNPTNADQDLENNDE